jgi:hypothetical protein
VCLCVCVCVCSACSVCKCVCVCVFRANPKPPRAMSVCWCVVLTHPPPMSQEDKHARGTAHESSDAAAVAQAASRPCSPALPLVAARLHGCHDNLGSRMAAAAYRDAGSDPEASWPRGSAFGSGGWCGAREGEVDRGAERSASAGLVLACSTLTSLSGHRCRTRKARLLPVTFVSAGFVDRP